MSKGYLSILSFQFYLNGFILSKLKFYEPDIQFINCLISGINALSKFIQLNYPADISHNSTTIK